MHRKISTNHALFFMIVLYLFFPTKYILGDIVIHNTFLSQRDRDAERWTDRAGVSVLANVICSNSSIVVVVNAPFTT